MRKPIGFFVRQRNTAGSFTQENSIDVQEIAAIVEFGNDLIPPYFIELRLIHVSGCNRCKFGSLKLSTFAQ